VTQPESPQAPTGNGAAASDGAAAPIAALRKFTQRRGSEAALERCDLCSATLPEEHEHLYDITRRQLLCTCAPCTVMGEVRAKGGHRRVPRRYLALHDFQMSDEQWDELAIPVSMAFLTTGSDGSIHCHYPSPAGPTESLLTLDGWTALVDQNPVLRELEPDVEALLVNRLAESREEREETAQTGHEYYLVPIDACFELVGLIRVHWRGFSGGKKAWDRIEDFFNGLRQRAEPGGEA
jgi:Family of unknown function (DUF5947)